MLKCNYCGRPVKAGKPVRRLSGSVLYYWSECKNEQCGASNRPQRVVPESK